MSEAVPIDPSTPESRPETAPTVAATTACSILVRWANEQDHWVRRIVGEVLVSRQELPESVIEEAYRAYRVEKGLDEGVTHTLPPLSEVADAAETIEPLQLTVLDQVSGVNALAPNQSIAFNPRLTILFGENASGKTGYVRVLKSVANVRTAEPVLGNVRDASVASKSARLRFKVGTAPEGTHLWTGQTGIAPFTRMNVFDSRAVTIHVDDDLNYSYTPRDLSLFRHVATAIDGVKQRLDRDRVTQTRTDNPFMARFDRAVSFYAKIETLGPTSVIGEFHSLAALSDAELSGRDELRERVEMLRSQSIESHVQIGSVVFESPEVVEVVGKVNAVAIRVSAGTQRHPAAIACRKRRRELSPPAGWDGPLRRSPSDNSSGAHISLSRLRSSE